MAIISEWFKIIENETVIGTATNLDFARYSEKSGRVHICKAIEGQYVVVNGKYYRDDWMLATSKDSYVDWSPAVVVSIPEAEYDILNRGDESETKIVNTEKTGTDISEKVFTHDETVTLDFVRKRKLSELSSECERSIENGFDLVLGDGVSHHFSLTIQDQLNLLDLQKALNEGNDLVYHADGELAQFYGEDDARDILIGATKWKQYNIVLYNNLKHWINSIEDISVIDAIKYDSVIPNEYCTAVLQTLTENF